MLPSRLRIGGPVTAATLTPAGRGDSTLAPWGPVVQGEGVRDRFPVYDVRRVGNGDDVGFLLGALADPGDAQRSQGLSTGSERRLVIRRARPLTGSTKLTSRASSCSGVEKSCGATSRTVG